MDLMGRLRRMRVISSKGRKGSSSTSLPIFFVQQEMGVRSKQERKGQFFSFVLLQEAFVNVGGINKG